MAERDKIRASAQRNRPKSIREAPQPVETLAEKEERIRQYGKPHAWRIDPDLPDALGRATGDAGVSNVSDLVEYLLRAGLQLLAAGRLPIKTKTITTNNRIRYVIVGMPPIPDKYQAEE